MPVLNSQSNPTLKFAPCGRWAVPLGGTTAYRIHPETFEIATYDGLNSPYTYSDMAGGQINNVVCPQ